jgi:hypothetical protein
MHHRRIQPHGCLNAGYDPCEAPKAFEQLLKEWSDKGALANFFYSSDATNVARMERTAALVASSVTSANCRLFLCSAGLYSPG